VTWISTHNEPHGFLPAKHGNPNRCQTCGGWEETPCHSLRKKGKLAGTKLGSGPNAHLRISAVSIEKFMESNRH
jgi:hypothetical protein